MRSLFHIFFIFFSAPLAAQLYTPIHTSLTGDDLLGALVTDYRPAFVLSYGDARDLMYSEIDNQQDTVHCIYTQHGIFLPDGVDPSVHVFMSGDPDGINAEHVYPRAKGADAGNPLADMHHLFPCRVEVNTNRGSFPFAEINDAQTESWYINNIELNNIPSQNKDAYSEGQRGNSGRFEPRESRKGDIARAMFYFYTMYKIQADNADPNFFSAQMSTLCAWHEQDPVDAQEYERTFAIAAVQDDKPNPFILDCSLVERAYCQSSDISCPMIPTVSSTAIQSVETFYFYPNPLNETLYIECKSETQVKIYDVLGRTLLTTTIFTDTGLPTSFLQPGTYILQLNQSSYKLVK